MGQQTGRHALTGTLAPSEKNDPRGHPTGKSCSTLMQAVQPEKHRPLTPTLPGSGRRQQAKSRGLSAMQRTPESTWGSQRGHRCTFGGSSSLSSVGHLAPLAPGPRGGRGGALLFASPRIALLALLPQRASWPLLRTTEAADRAGTSLFPSSNFVLADASAAIATCPPTQLALLSTQ